MNKKNAWLGALVYISLSVFVFLSPALIRFSDVAYLVSNLPYRQLDAIIFSWLSLAFIFQSSVGMLFAVFYGVFFFARFWLNMEVLVRIVFVLLLFLAVISFLRMLLSPALKVKGVEQKLGKKNVIVIVFVGVCSVLFVFGRFKIFEVQITDVLHRPQVDEVLSDKQEPQNVASVKVVFKSGLLIEGEIIFEDPFFYTVLDQKGKEHIALKEEILKIESLA